jgi:hypothetical protein
MGDSASTVRGMGSFVYAMPDVCAKKKSVLSLSFSSVYESVYATLNYPKCSGCLTHSYCLGAVSCCLAATAEVQWITA